MTRKFSIACLVAALAVFGCKRGASGEWAVNRGKAVDELTLQEKDGVLTGQIKEDSEYGGHVCDVHGIHAGTKIEWAYNYNEAGSTTGDNGLVVYTMKGELDGDSMGGKFTVIGPFSIRLSSPAEPSLWVAKRKN